MTASSCLCPPPPTAIMHTCAQRGMSRCQMFLCHRLMRSAVRGKGQLGEVRLSLEGSWLGQVKQALSL